MGKSIANIKGKTVSHKPESLKLEKMSKTIPVLQDQIFYMDIMFVEQIPFLVSITKPINMLQVNRLKDRHMDTILKQLMKQLSVYSSRGFSINKIRCDPETGLIGLNDTLGKDGFEMDASGQNEKVPQVERAIRTIKNH